MPLELSDVWTWRQIVSIATVMDNQKTLLCKATDQTLEELDKAICRIWWLVMEEFDRREDPRHE